MPSQYKFNLSSMIMGILFLILGYISLSAQDSLTSTHFDAHKAFEQQAYEQAIQIYEEQVQEHGVNASTLYNMAVCYRKMGRLPETILMLERAMLLEPTRGDIRGALLEAYRNTKDVQAEVVLPPISRVDALAYALSLPIWAILALCCLAGSVFGFFAFRLMPTLLGRKRVFYASIGMFALFLLCNAFLAHQLYYHAERQERLILIKPVALMNGPKADGKPIDKLNEGTAVTLLKSESGWCEVKTAYGHAGWIPIDAMQAVVSKP